MTTTTTTMATTTTTATTTVVIKTTIGKSNVQHYGVHNINNASTLYIKATTTLRKTQEH